ncbi:MAG: biotin/lipoyl-containing protein, partial [Sphingomonadaceae bacterium]
MATEVLLPKLGFSMNEGILSEWLVADGAEVKEGDPLF